MKTALICISSLALAAMALGQDQSPSPAAISPAATIAPVATASATAKDDLESRIERKVKKGFHVTIGDDDKDREHDRVRVHKSSSDDDNLGALVAIPIVGIIFGTLFLAPVAVVGLILLFNFMRQRSLHRTVRMMVEKGQPVPAALFAPPAVIRARSDMRRGVVLVMIGIGLMCFFAAVNDWEGGAWTLGLIPFLIGAGYLVVWKLEGNKPGEVKRTDNPPPLP